MCGLCAGCTGHERQYPEQTPHVCASLNCCQTHHQEQFLGSDLHAVSQLDLKMHAMLIDIGKQAPEVYTCTPASHMSACEC